MQMTLTTFSLYFALPVVLLLLGALSRWIFGAEPISWLATLATVFWRILRKISRDRSAQSEFSVCGVSIPERLVRHDFDTSSLRHEQRQLHIIRTQESTKLMTKIRKACKKFEPNAAHFTINGRERQGTFVISENDEREEFLIVLTAA